MPLPDDAPRIEGGCYCVEIPALTERPLCPLAPTEAPVSMPSLAIDHCNDCRHATGSVLPAWLYAPLDICSITLVAASCATLAPKAAAREGQAQELSSSWLLAANIFATSPVSTNTINYRFLTSYESSHERWRWFCARCGTGIAYTAAMPAGFPSMLDITFGSIDHRHFDSEALVPERHLWWNYGIYWIRRLATKGYGTLPIHSDYRIAETVSHIKPTFQSEPPVSRCDH